MPQLRHKEASALMDEGFCRCGLEPIITCPVCNTAYCPCCYGDVRLEKARFTLKAGERVCGDVTIVVPAMCSNCEIMAELMYCEFEIAHGCTPCSISHGNFDARLRAELARMAVPLEAMGTKGNG